MTVLHFAISSGRPAKNTPAIDNERNAIHIGTRSRAQVENGADKVFGCSTSAQWRTDFPALFARCGAFELSHLRWEDTRGQCGCTDRVGCHATGEDLGQTLLGALGDLV